MHANRNPSLRARLAQYLSERPDVAGILLGERPTADRPICYVCRDKGWYLVETDGMPAGRSCSRCSGAPAEDLDRWGHRLIEEPSGDVDDGGVYRLDGDAA